MPKQLGFSALEPERLQADYKAAQRIGPCALGQQALYLNSFFWDRRYYLPISSANRVFKRVAMSKGGFSGKGIFGAIPYLVVVYDGGKELQCNFKREEDVDLFLAALRQANPQVPTLSAAAEQRLAERAAAEAARPRPKLTPTAQAEAERLEQARSYLEQHQVQAAALSAAARAKRVNDRANPAYKWVALAIVLLGLAALVYGAATLLAHDTSGVYYALFGMAAILLFSSANVLPTARNNRKAVAQRLAQAQQEMEAVCAACPGGLPVPSRYAHPIVLERMLRAIREGRAETARQALELVKADLKALNADVQVEQEEYDQVVAVKPLFLVANYE